MLLALLPVQLAALLLTACGGEVVSTPPAERFAPVAAPVPPEGEALCEGEPCLSDRQFGNLFDAVVDALERANSKLEWLRDYYQPKAD
jgi:hypothetical protein